MKKTYTIPQVEIIDTLAEQMMALSTIGNDAVIKPGEDGDALTKQWNMWDVEE